MLNIDYWTEFPFYQLVVLLKVNESLEKVET